MREDQLTFCIIVVLMMATFLTVLGLIIRAIIPAPPANGECPVEDRASCPLCDGDPLVCAEISLGSLSKQSNKKETNPFEEVLPKEVGRASVQAVASTAEVRYTPRNLQIGP